MLIHLRIGYHIIRKRHTSLHLSMRLNLLLLSPKIVLQDEDYSGASDFTQIRLSMHDRPFPFYFHLSIEAAQPYRLGWLYSVAWGFINKV